MSAAAAGGLPADIAAAAGAAGALFLGLSRQTATFSTAEDAVNALQQVAVDLGLEPPQVQQLVLLLEWAAPSVSALYKAGVIFGGSMPSDWPAGGGPAIFRGR